MVFTQAVVVAPLNMVDNEFGIKAVAAGANFTELQQQILADGKELVNQIV